jgi:hypothetical protein
MKKYYLLTIFILFIFTIPGSAQIVKTKYTIIDQVDANYQKKWFSEKYSITFKLINLDFLDTAYSIQGVEVEIRNSKNEQVGNSFSFSNFGHSYGFSGGAIYQKVNETGFVFLNKENLFEFKKFFNNLMGATLKNPDKYTMYKLTLNDRLDIGIFFDPKTQYSPSWSFFINVDNAVYETDYESGKMIIIKLSSFSNYLENGKM